MVSNIITKFNSNMDFKKISLLLFVSIVSIHISAQEKRIFYWEEDSINIKSEGLFKDAKESGLWKFWNKDGKLINSTEWKASSPSKIISTLKCLVSGSDYRLEKIILKEHYH